MSMWDTELSQGCRSDLEVPKQNVPGILCPLCVSGRDGGAGDCRATGETSKPRHPPGRGESGTGGKRGTRGGGQT